MLANNGKLRQQHQTKHAENVGEGNKFYNVGGLTNERGQHGQPVTVYVTLQVKMVYNR